MRTATSVTLNASCGPKQVRVGRRRRRAVARILRERRVHRGAELRPEVGAGRAGILGLLLEMRERDLHHALVPERRATAHAFEHDAPEAVDVARRRGLLAADA